MNCAAPTLLVLASTFLIAVACSQPKPSSPQRQAPSNSVTNAAPGPKPAWSGSVQAPKFMAINQEVLLVAAGLDGAVLTGQPELIHEPEDFDVTWFAKQGVKDSSLPPAVAGKVGSPIVVIYLKEPPETCTERLGTFAAYAWAEASLDLTKQAMARRLFAEGSRYLGAMLGDCGQSWVRSVGTFTPASELRYWEIRAIGAELMPEVVKNLVAQPQFKELQSGYERFLRERQERVTKLEAARQSDPAVRERLGTYQPAELVDNSPEQLIDAWVVTGDWAPSLLVARYRGHHEERMPTLEGSGEEILEFDGTLLALWAFSDHIDSLISVLTPPAIDGGDLHGFEISAAVSRPGGPPALLYKAYSGGVLQPSGGSYVVDDVRFRPVQIGPE